MQKDLFNVQSFPSLKGFTSDATGNALRVLIATEEIIGPVRNGGIASTYYHLARGLAAEGHKVTVLYLKGRTVENETPEHWIEHYASFGIDLVYLPELEAPLACASPKWQWRWLSFYQWLKANDHFDMVHTSEWRGGAFYCLQAKRLGLAFQDTLFVMKTSSPYIWNRHYQMRPIDKPELVVAAYAEQKCVEWSDIVVGGSAHLLSFMDHVGYTLPEGRTYVQPNIVDFSEVLVEDQRPDRAFGDIVDTKEIVFFGRLEPRKGLELFVFAVDVLVARGVEIEKITFLGKEGEKLQGQGNLKPIEFITAHAAQWPFPIEIVSDRNQPEALSLMCSRDMIAVMPSLIENSTMAVYETLVHKIPFIATRVGGTPELIDPADHEATLVRPEVQHLADRMASALEDGHPVARPAFENKQNLDTWYGFHRYLAENGHERLAPKRIAAEAKAQTIAYVSAPSDQHNLSQLVEDRTPEMLAAAEHVIVIAFLPTPTVLDTIAKARDKGFTIIEMIGASVGECFNRARETLQSDILIFDAAGAHNLAPEFFDTVGKTLAEHPTDFLTSLFQIQSFDLESETLFAPMGADLATQTLSGDAYGVELLIGTRAAFDECGPFDSYRVSAGAIHEYIGRAAIGGRELLVIPEPLFKVAEGQESLGTADPICSYLVRKPVLENAGLSARKLLLLDQGSLGGGGPRKANSGPLIMARAHRAPDSIAWLTNVDRKGHVFDKVRQNDSILLGFDDTRGVLQVAKRHKGELLVTANKEVIRHERDYDTQGEFVISEIELIPFLESQEKTHLRIELIVGEKVRAAGLAVQRLEPSIYFLSSHRSIFWGDDFAFMLDQVKKLRAQKSAKKAPAPIIASNDPGSSDDTRTTVTPNGGSTSSRPQGGMLGRIRQKMGF